MAQHCPECGFANDDGASYCQRCGAFLAQSEQPPEPFTATYKVGDTGELEEVELEDVVSRGAALVIRAGGGRAGESFALEGDRLSVGRRPDSDVFLDDVTVSRDQCSDRAPRQRLLSGRLRLAQRHLRESAPDRLPPAGRRRRTANRQVQAGLPEPLMASG